MANANQPAYKLNLLTKAIIYIFRGVVLVNNVCK